MNFDAIMERRHYLQTSLEHYRKLTFKLNKVNIKRDICMILAKYGYYYHCDYRKIKCCMDCSDYTVDYIVLNATIIATENLFSFIKNLHKSCCCFQPTIIRSKIFLDSILTLKYERERLNSFIEFPCSHIVDPKALAKDGFYYERFEDVCCCIFCDVRLHCWQYFAAAAADKNNSSNPREIHLKISPMCPFLKNEFVGKMQYNIPLAVSSILDDLVFPGDNYPLPGCECHNHDNITGYNNDNNNYKDLGFSLFKTAEILHGKFVNYQKRVESFDDWQQEERIQQSPSKLADAGFVYIGE